MFCLGLNGFQQIRPPSGEDGQNLHCELQDKTLTTRATLVPPTSNTCEETLQPTSRLVDSMHMPT